MVVSERPLKRRALEGCSLPPPPFPDYVRISNMNKKEPQVDDNDGYGEVDKVDDTELEGESFKSGPLERSKRTETGKQVMPESDEIMEEDNTEFVVDTYTNKLCRGSIEKIHRDGILACYGIVDLSAPPAVFMKLCG